jgi:PST family polysaccharide transporter
LIQRRVIRRLQLDTVFWVSLAMGAALAMLVFLASFGATRFFGDPQVGTLLRVLCISFILDSLSAVPAAILSRLLRFRTEFFIQTASVLARAGVAVLLATLGFGVWSLIAGSIAGVLTAVVMHFAAVCFVPRFRFHKEYLWTTWKTSGFYFLGGAIYYLNMSVDLILIGRYLGAAPLGLYQNARSLTDEIRARLAAPLAQTLFPAFSAAQTESSGLQGLFLRSGRLLATAIFLMGFVVSAISPELIALLYGPKWLGMIPLVSVFGIGAAIRGSTALASPLLNASNRVGITLRYDILGATLMVIGVSLSLQYGIEAVAGAVAAASAYQLAVYSAALRILGMNLSHMYKTMAPPAIAGTLMWLSIQALRPALTAYIDSAAGLLFVLASLGTLIYVIALRLISLQHLLDAKRAFLKLSKSVVENA